MPETVNPEQKFGEEIAPAHARDPWDAQDESVVLGLPLASAKGMPKPNTTLASPPAGDVRQLTVSIVGDIRRAPELDEVDQINRAAHGHTRTPLMTVIEAILARHGGSLKLDELTELVGRHWNRPFPSSPFSKEEFLYCVVSSSDRVRVG